MQEANTTFIKATHEELRFHLATLAAAAFKNPKKYHCLLELNKKQAQKYHGRNQFIFDTRIESFEKLPRKVQTLLLAHFKEVFGEQYKEEVIPGLVVAIYESLCSAHPDGVEIWVNDENPDLRPLVENIAAGGVDSIFDASLAMLENLYAQQKEFISVYYKGDQNQVTDEINRKYNKIYKDLHSAYASYVKAINSLYDTGADDKHQGKEARRLISDFQKVACAKLAVFKQMEHTAKVKKEDYKKVYKELGKYEQKQKLHKIANPNGAISNERQKARAHFNRDIFALDIKEKDGENNIIDASLHYYDRHYLLTQEQIAFILPNEIADNYRLQPTATAHNPDYVSLSNSAQVDEGFYANGKVHINVMFGRNGSPTPSEISKSGLDKADIKHLSVFYGAQNMEQRLLNCRVDFIRSILSENFKYDFPYRNIDLIACTVGFQITKQIHEYRKNLPQEKSFAINWELIRQALGEFSSKALAETQALRGFSSEDLDQVQGSLEKYDLVTISNFHDHLINGTGISSYSEGQRVQFKNSIPAAYASAEDENHLGYLYFDAPINKMRKSTRFGDRTTPKRLEKTNSVALLEMALAIEKRTSIKLFETDELKNGLKDYKAKIGETIKAAKTYVNQLENSYIIEQRKFESLTTKHAQLTSIMKQAPKNLVKRKELQADIKKIKDGIKSQKLVLKRIKKNLKGLRKVFKEKEDISRNTAFELNNKLYKSLSQKLNETETFLSENPDRVDEYRAFKGFYLIEMLFADKKPQWQSEEFNGGLQVLIHLVSDQLGVPSSFGCKSANDRAVKVALMLSLLSERLRNPKMKLDEDFVKNLVKDADSIYAWSITHQHTLLDRSAVPKTKSDVLPGVDGVLKSGTVKEVRDQAEQIIKQYNAASSVASSSQAPAAARAPELQVQKTEQKQTLSSSKAYLDFAGSAAHKRKGQHKKLNSADLFKMNLNGMGRPFANLFEGWIDRVEDSFKPITALLREFCTETWLDKKAKIAKLKAIQTRIEKSKPILGSNANLQHLTLQISFLIASYEGKNAETYDQLSQFLSSLNQMVISPSPEYCRLRSSSAGFNQLYQILDQYKPSMSFLDLLKLFNTVHELAKIKSKDFSNSNFFRKEEKRPLWLCDFYKTLAKVKTWEDFSTFRKADSHFNQQIKQLPVMDEDKVNQIRGFIISLKNLTENYKNKDGTITESQLDKVLRNFTSADCSPRKIFRVFHNICALAAGNQFETNFPKQCSELLEVGTQLKNMYSLDQFFQFYEDQNSLFRKLEGGNESVAADTLQL